MIQRFMKSMAKKNNKKGFTLVELMVVVVIIGILVAIAVPIYNSVTTNASKNACLANLRTIDGAKVIFSSAKADGNAVDTDWPAKYLTGGMPTCPGKGTDHGTYSNTDATKSSELTAKASCDKHGSY